MYIRLFNSDSTLFVLMHACLVLKERYYLVCSYIHQFIAILLNVKINVQDCTTIIVALRFTHAIRIIICRAHAQFSRSLP